MPYYLLTARNCACLQLPRCASSPSLCSKLGTKCCYLLTKLRVLAAAALRKLAPIFPPYFLASVMPELLDAAMSADVPTRHGAALALAQVCCCVCVCVCVRV